MITMDTIILSVRKMFLVIAIGAITIINSAGQNIPDTLSMTLEQCLTYAKENSITLQQAQLNIENKAADEMRAKGNFMPNIAASIGQDLRYTPLTSETPTTNYNGSYGLDLSLPIITGGRNKATNQQSKIESKIVQLSFFEQENTIETSVTETFVQILYAMEQISVAENALELQVKSLERGSVYLEVGKINDADFALLESAKADGEYNLILAKTTLSNLNVRLKHLLEISQEVTLVAVAPDLSQEKLKSQALPSVGEVYTAALQMRPEIAISSLSITSAEWDVKAAKSGYYPSLSFSAGAGLNHSSSSNFTFSDQMRNNFNTSFGLRLSVPIFSSYQNKSNVMKAENAVTSATLALTDNQKNLYQTIETLHNNANNAKAKFQVSNYKLEAVERSLRLVTEQYDVGMKNIIELLTEQDNFLQSSQEQLINKYQYILNRALLEYYRTDIIAL